MSTTLTLPAPFVISAVGRTTLFLSQAAASYANNQVYTAVIAPPQNARVVLAFSTFETEYNYDYVTVFNDTTLTAALFPRTSGTQAGFTVTGTINTPVVVRLITDSSSAYAGLAFSATACAGAADGACAIPSPTPSRAPAAVEAESSAGAIAGGIFGALIFVGIIATVVVVAQRDAAKRRMLGGPVMVVSTAAPAPPGAGAGMPPPPGAYGNYSYGAPGASAPAPLGVPAPPPMAWAQPPPAAYPAAPFSGAPPAYQGAPTQVYPAPGTAGAYGAPGAAAGAYGSAGAYGAQVGAPVVAPLYFPAGWRQHGPDAAGNVWYTDAAGQAHAALPRD